LSIRLDKPLANSFKLPQAVLHLCGQAEMRRRPIGVAFTSLCPDDCANAGPPVIQAAIKTAPDVSKFLFS
jgi:hypothetical protein